MSNGSMRQFRTFSARPWNREVRPRADLPITAVEGRLWGMKSVAAAHAERRLSVR